MTVFKSLASRFGNPYALDKDLGTYPFDGIIGRSAECDALVQWLLGTKDLQAVEHVAPLGGAALITGFRGVGKTTLVRKAIFDASLLGLYNQGLIAPPGHPSEKRFGRFDRTTLSQAIVGKKKKIRDASAHVYLPVFIDVATPISAEDLLRRVLRRTYFAAADFRLGGLSPELMRRLRMRYIRSVGEVSIEHTERISEKLGMKVDILGNLEVTAEQELEFADTLRVVAGKLSVEEAEDEILGFGAELASGPLAVKEGLIPRLTKQHALRTQQQFADLRDALQGTKGYHVHLVLVFDELDKLEDNQDRPVVEGALRAPWEVIARLKLLFGARELSAICIAGHVTELQWLREQRELDPMLRSVFSRHLYVPHATLDEVVEVFDCNDRERACALSFLARGRYKDLTRRFASPVPDAALGVLAPLLQGWGEPASSQAGDSPAALLGAAASLEDIAGALVAGIAPDRDVPFIRDLARAWVASAALWVADPEVLDGESGTNARNLVAERTEGFIPRPLAQAAFDRMRVLVRPRPLAGSPPPPPTQSSGAEVAGRLV